MGKSSLELKPNHIYFKILDKDWRLIVLKKTRYKKKHGEDSIAITDVHKRTISAGPSGKDYETIVHELVHAYLSELCTHSAEIDADALEEIFAEVMAKHGEALLLLGRNLASEIQKRKL